MAIVPAATPSRINSGVTCSCSATIFMASVMMPCLANCICVAIFLPPYTRLTCTPAIKKLPLFLRQLVFLQLRFPTPVLTVSGSKGRNLPLSSLFAAPLAILFNCFYFSTKAKNMQAKVSRKAKLRKILAYFSSRV